MLKGISEACLSLSRQLFGQVGFPLIQTFVKQLTQVKLALQAEYLKEVEARVREVALSLQ